MVPIKRNKDTSRKCVLFSTVIFCEVSLIFKSIIIFENIDKISVIISINLYQMRGDIFMKRIFISSTFRDMNAERDLFHEQICPDLNEVARMYGESIDVCDLRWGVDTTTLETEDGAKKVLSVCLDEIEYCMPYMIILLGERYGWIPNAELVDEAVKSRREFELDELEKSITALEIEYGVLNNQRQKEQTFFYFRELEGEPPEDYLAEDEVHREKLLHLKQRILKLCGDRVKTYSVRWDAEEKKITGLEKFAQMVTDDILQLMGETWKAYGAMTPYERDQKGQWEFAKQKSDQFIAREHLIKQYTNELESQTSVLAIKGPSGSGKSTLIGRMAMEMKKSGYLCYPIFCGSTSLSSTAFDVLKYMANILENLLELPSFEMTYQGEGTPNFQEWLEYLEKLIQEYSKEENTPICIFIDAVDQLLNGEDRDYLQFLPLFTTNYVKFVLSMLDTFKINRDISIHYLPSLKREDRKSLIRGVLVPTRRSLSDDVIAAMAEKAGGDMPLYLSLLISRLEMMDEDDFVRINAYGGGMDAINRKQLEIVNECANDLNQLCVEILKEATRKIGNNLPDIVSKFLAVSRYGLRERDLEGIFKMMCLEWDALTFARFRKYMSRFFIQRQDGRLDFAHKTFRQGFQNEIVDEKEYHQMMLKYFRTLPECDEIRMREMAYHCIKADDRQFLADYLAELIELDNSIEDDQDELRKEQIREACIFAAKDIAMLGLKDQGQWMCNVIKDTTLTKKRVEFFSFVIFFVLERYSERKKGLLFAKEGFQTILEQKDILLASSKGRMLYDLSLGKLAMTYTRLGGIENYKKAEKLMKLASEEMEVEWEDVDEYAEIARNSNRINILSLYQYLAGLYLSMATQENVKKAIVLLQEILDKAEKLKSKVSEKDVCSIEEKIIGNYEMLANAYAQWQEEDSYKKSYYYITKARERAEALDESTVSSSIYSRLVFLIMQEPELEPLENAFSYAQKAVAIGEERVRKNASTDNMQKLIKAWKDLASLHHTIGDKENLRTALSLMEKVVSVQKKICAEQDTEEAWVNLTVYYQEMAEWCCAMDTEDYFCEATVYYEKAVEIIESVTKLSTMYVPQALLMTSYMGLGKSKERIASVQEKQSVMGYYQKAIEIGESLIKDEIDRNISIFLRQCYESMSRLLTEQEKVEEALVYEVQKLEMNRRGLKSMGTFYWVEHLMESLISVCNITIELEGEYLPLALECYKERLQLGKQWALKGHELLSWNDERIIYGNIAWIYENLEEGKDLQKALENRYKQMEILTMHKNDISEEKFNNLTKRIKEKIDFLNQKLF